MGSKVLENAEIRKLVSPLSIENYHKMCEAGLLSQKTELVEGVILDKMTKSPIHSYFSSLFFEILREKKPANTIVLTEKPLTLLRSEPEPDIMVVEGTLADYKKQNPATALLVIEITNTSIGGDREKISIYAEAKIANYWIVNLPKKQIEAYSSPNGDVYSQKTTYQEKESIPVFASTIDLNKIFD